MGPKYMGRGRRKKRDKGLVVVVWVCARSVEESSSGAPMSFSFFVGKKQKAGGDQPREFALREARKGKTCNIRLQPQL